MKELTILNSFCLHVTPAVQEGEQHPVSEVCFIFKNNKYFAYLVPYSFLFSSFSLSLSLSPQVFTVLLRLWSSLKELLGKWMGDTEVITVCIGQIHHYLLNQPTLTFHL